MYNFADVNPVILNLSAEPMYGKLVFVVPGTTGTYVNVRDTEGNNLGHEVTTNQYGRLSTQVVLDQTVDVQYWEFTGTLYDVEDSTQFTLIRTERVYNPEETIDIDVEGALSVSSTDELRALDVSGYSNYTTCIRTGYYRGGDCAPLVYVWDTGVSGNDDGGYVIKPTGWSGMGRWIAVFPEYVDVRWFGVKGASMQGQVTYQSSAVLAATSRSMIMGKTLYFPSTGSNTYYGLDNVAINVGTADIRLDAGVFLVGKADTVNSISCGDLYCDRSRQVFLTSDSNKFSVTAKEVWTASLAEYGDVVADKVHWNENIRKTSWSDCSISFEVQPEDGMSFDNCSISFSDTAYRFPANDQLFSFANMEFTDRYFDAGSVLDYGYITVDSSCLTDVKDFEDADNWFNCRQAIGDTDIDCTDVKMDSVTVTASRTLHNVNANILAAGAGVDLIVVDGVVDKISYQNSTGSLAMIDVRQTNSGSSIVAGTLSLNGCAISATIVCTALACERSDFNNAVFCNTISSDSCSYASTINVYFASKLQVVFNNNTVGANSVMRISKYSGDSTTDVQAVDCSWRNNTILRKTAWITLDRTYLAANEALHDYVYEGNNGGGLNGTDKLIDYNVGGVSSITSAGLVVGSVSGHYELYWLGSPFTSLTLFTLGTVNVRARITASIIGTEVTDGTYSVSRAPLIQMPDYVMDVSTNDLFTVATSDGSETVQALNNIGGYSWSVNMGTASYKVTGPSGIVLWQVLEAIPSAAYSAMDGRAWTFRVRIERV